MSSATIIKSFAVIKSLAVSFFSFDAFLLPLCFLSEQHNNNSNHLSLLNSISCRISQILAMQTLPLPAILDVFGTSTAAVRWSLGFPWMLFPFTVLARAFPFPGSVEGSCSLCAKVTLSTSSLFSSWLLPNFRFSFSRIEKHSRTPLAQSTHWTKSRLQRQQKERERGGGGGGVHNQIELYPATFIKTVVEKNMQKYLGYNVPQVVLKSES